MDTLTKAGAAEYAQRGIRVNSVAPGGFETPAIKRYFEKFPEHAAKTVGTNALRRLGQPGKSRSRCSGSRPTVRPMSPGPASPATAA